MKMLQLAYISLKKGMFPFKMRHKDRNRLISLQNHLLQRIVHHAEINVPFYRDLFNSMNGSHYGINSAAELHRLPLISKKKMKLAGKETLLSRTVKEKTMGIYKTTGSTGIPFEIHRTHIENFIFHLFRMEIMRHYGLKISDKVIRLRNTGYYRIPRLWKAARLLGMFRQATIDTLPHSSQETAVILSREKANVITGYSGTLGRIARILSERSMKAPVPRFLVGGADMLTPALRNQISDTFQAPIFDTYECHEVGPIAWECPETGLYHVCGDNVFLEILRDGIPVKEGEQGEAVVTGLNVYSMPFIRYRLEDIVTRGPDECPCGMPFSTIHSIEGKQQDTIVLSNGRDLNPRKITRLIQDRAPWVLQFRITQKKIDSFHLEIVSTKQISLFDKESIRNLIISQTGIPSKVEIIHVPAIPPGPGGKYRYVISELTQSSHEASSTTI